MGNTFIRNSFLLFFVLLFAGMFLQAQTDREKELLQMERELADENRTDEDMFNCYDDLIFEYSSIDMEKSRYFFNKALSFAKKKMNMEWEARFMTNMGYNYYMLGIRDSVLFYLDKSLTLIEGKKIYNEEQANYEVRGLYFSRLFNHEKAMEAYLKALDACEKDKKQRETNKQSIDRCLATKVRTLSNIADVYGQMFNYNKVVEYYLDAIKIMNDNPNVDFGHLIYQLPGALGEYYLQMEQYDKALPLLETYYNLAAAKEDIGSMAYASGYLSRYYRHCGNYSKAVDYAKKALLLAEKTNFPSIINMAERHLIKAYGEMKNYKTAIFYAERLLLKIDKDNWGAMRELYGNLSLFYGGVGNIDKMAEYLTMYFDITTKMSDENLQNALQEMQVKYDVQQKEQEIIVQQTEIKRGKTLRSVFIGGLIGTGLLVALLTYIIVLRNKRNRELAEMNNTKDQFFGIISHDLKNPAISQRDALQILLDDSAQWDINSLTKYYRSLLKSANNQVILLYNLLNWAQVHTGRMAFNPIAFDFYAAFESDIALLKNTAEQKEINFTITIPENTIITGDNNMITIVVRNLLTNAMKFTHSGGTVSLDISPASAAHRISVSDTGIGISAEQMQNMFRMDKKRSRLGTAGEQGSGLGLIVCKELVEKHGSALHIESEEGKGSRFWFDING
jgi:signal transduction histidine kinase